MKRNKKTFKNKKKIFFLKSRKKKRKNKKSRKNKRNKMNKTLRKNKRNKMNKILRRQKGGSLFTHLIDNDLFNWIIYLFQNFSNTFFGLENNVINPSIMKNQFV